MVQDSVGHEDEDPHTYGPLKYFLGVPLGVAVLVGVVAGLLRVWGVIQQTIGRPPILVALLALAVIVAVLFYGTIRGVDWFRG